MQCSCGGITLDRVSDRKQEDGTRLIVNWSECNACGRAHVFKREVKQDD